MDADDGVNDGEPDPSPRRRPKPSPSPPWLELRSGPVRQRSFEAAQRASFENSAVELLDLKACISRGLALEAGHTDTRPCRVRVLVVNGEQNVVLRLWLVVMAPWSLLRWSRLHCVKPPDAGDAL